MKKLLIINSILIFFAYNVLCTCFISCHFSNESLIWISGGESEDTNRRLLAKLAELVKHLKDTKQEKEYCEVFSEAGQCGARMVNYNFSKQILSITEDEYFSGISGQFKLPPDELQIIADKKMGFIELRKKYTYLFELESIPMTQLHI